MHRLIFLYANDSVRKFSRNINDCGEKKPPYTNSLSGYMHELMKLNIFMQCTVCGEASDMQMFE